MKNGFVKVAAASPVIRVADADYNASLVADCIRSAAAEGVKVLVFPELTLTGCSCYDLFTHRVLLRGAEAALLTVLEATRGADLLAFVGLPLGVGAKVYNVAAALYDGEVLGLVPSENGYGYFSVPEDGECLEVDLRG
ncbi:MAG: NAD(+) synthase, partial [Oscillospiraceae bacterium]|nr:NAD(+) synthase [Oscillospiraceae bacterium]